jgi:hypothetical protein
MRPRRKVLPVFRGKARSRRERLDMGTAPYDVTRRTRDTELVKNSLEISFIRIPRDYINETIHPQRLAARRVVIPRYSRCMANDSARAAIKST